MTSSYETIFNKFLGRVTDYDFLTIDEAYLWEQVSEWVENSIATPSLRVIFSSITCDKETQTLTYTLRNSAGDELSDQLYVEKLFAMSFVIQWLEPTVKNKINLNQMFGGKEERWFSQAQHLSELRGILEDTVIRLKKEIRDHDAIYNSYIGTSING
jgi:hypothetical protein